MTYAVLSSHMKNKYLIAVLGWIGHVFDHEEQKAYQILRCLWAPDDSVILHYT